MYENNSYSRRYNIVSRNQFISKQPLFTHLNLNYDTEKTLMKNSQVFTNKRIKYILFQAVYSCTISKC